MATSSTFFKALLFLNLLFTVHSQQVFENEDQHPDVEAQYRLHLEENTAAAFNYDTNGTDWTGLCKQQNWEQSPYNLTGNNQTWKYETKKFDFKTHKTILMNVTVDQQVVDWQGQQFSFVARYRPQAINQSMPVNMVQMLDLDTTDVATKGLFGFWGAEPKYIEKQPQSHIVQWSFDHIRTHYPSEHRWNNEQADLEIQIFHEDLLHQSLSCSSHKGVIILLFNVNSTESNNGFFDDFTTVTPSTKNNGTMDISKLLDLASSMKSDISGYIGTDTMPPCTNGVCYYIYEKIFTITQDQLDYFKVKDVPFNARQTNLGHPEKYLYQMRNKGFFVNQ